MSRNSAVDGLVTQNNDSGCSANFDSAALLRQNYQHIYLFG